MLDSGHPGTEPWEKSCVEISPATVSVLALKPAENRPGIILRVQELAGRKAAARLRVHGAVHRASLAPWEIKTWRVTFRGKKGHFEECLPDEKSR